MMTEGQKKKKKRRLFFQMMRKLMFEVLYKKVISDSKVPNTFWEVVITYKNSDLMSKIPPLVKDTH